MIGVQIFIERGGGVKADLLTLPDNFSEIKLFMKMKLFWFKANPLNPPGPAIDQTSICYGTARRGGGGRA